MFSKLLDNPDLPLKDQKEILKDVLANNLKKNVHEVRLQFNHNYQKLKPILLQHWRYALRLALALHSWQVSLEMLQGKQDNAAVDLLYTVLKEDSRTRGQALMVEFTKTFQDNWRLLVILSIASDIIAPTLLPQDYSWFLATFVRASATVIQGYLTVKNETTNSKGDRIDSDLQLMENCETWIATSFVKMIKSLKGPDNEISKQTILAAFSQICGALLQNQKSGQLSVERLVQIQKTAGKYVLSSFSLKEVREAFLEQLRQYKYSIRLRKIEVPDRYMAKSQFAKEGICWLLALFLKDNPQLYSEQYRLQCWLIAFSQSLESFLHIKEDALNEIKDLLNKNIACNSLEVEYPLGLLLFNVFHSLKPEFEYFKEKLIAGSDRQTNLRRWRRLLNIDLESLNVDKATLVIQQISKEDAQEQQILLLIKALKFDFVSQELCKSVISLLSSASAAHPSAKNIIVWLINKEKASSRNLQLCAQLEKTLTL